MSSGLRRTHPWVDLSQLPILTVRFPESATDEEVAEYCAFNLWLWQEGLSSPATAIVDITSVVRGTSTQRRMVAENERTLRQAHEIRNAGVAMVANHPLLRGLITAVFWFSKPTYDYVIVRTFEQAYVWCEEQLRKTHAAQDPRVVDEP